MIDVKIFRKQWNSFHSIELGFVTLIALSQFSVINAQFDIILNFHSRIRLCLMPTEARPTQQIEMFECTVKPITLINLSGSNTIQANRWNLKRWSWWTSVTLQSNEIFRWNGVSNEAPFLFVHCYCWWIESFAINWMMLVLVISQLIHWVLKFIE